MDQSTWRVLQISIQNCRKPGSCPWGCGSCLCCRNSTRNCRIDNCQALVADITKTFALGAFSRFCFCMRLNRGATSTLVRRTSHLGQDSSTIDQPNARLEDRIHKLHWNRRCGSSHHTCTWHSCHRRSCIVPQAGTCPSALHPHPTRGGRRIPRRNHNRCHTHHFVHSGCMGLSTRNFRMHPIFVSPRICSPLPIVGSQNPTAKTLRSGKHRCWLAQKPGSCCKGRNDNSHLHDRDSTQGCQYNHERTRSVSRVDDWN